MPARNTAQSRAPLPPKKRRIGRYILAALIAIGYAAYAGHETAPPEPPEFIYVREGPDGFGILILTAAEMADKNAYQEALFCPVWLSESACQARRRAAAAALEAKRSRP